jgi:hypothetical protein
MEFLGTTLFGRSSYNVSLSPHEHSHALLTDVVRVACFLDSSVSSPCVSRLVGLTSLFLSCCGACRPSPAYEPRADKSNVPGFSTTWTLDCGGASQIP